MYCYDVGYHTFEESGHCQYFHEKKFTEAELTKLVEFALFEAAKNEITTRPDYVRLIIEDLMDSETFREFFLKRDFIPVEFEAKVSLFGWNKLIDKAWQLETDKSEKLMISRIKRKLTIWKKENKCN